MFLFPLKNLAHKGLLIPKDERMLAPIKCFGEYFDYMNQPVNGHASIYLFH